MGCRFRPRREKRWPGWRLTCNKPVAWWNARTRPILISRTPGVHTARIYGAMIYSAMPGVPRFFIRRLGPLMFRDPIFQSAARSATAQCANVFRRP